MDSRQVLINRTVRLVNHRTIPPDVLWTLFSHACSQINLPAPIPLRVPLRDSPSDLLAVFPSFQDARAALTLSSDTYSLSALRHTDLLPVETASKERDSSLRPLDTSRQNMISHLYSTSAHLPSPPYTISSNPPNPRTSFRVGDWMCSSLACSAHNFQRNTACIACGRNRSDGHSPLPPDPPTYPPPSLSPRFVGRYNHSAPQTPSVSAPPSATTPHFPIHAASHALAAAHAQLPAKAPPPQYPPLTPSGRALSVGGHVRNVSRDPLAPCIMYWPDNEPLPETTQIRPLDSTLITYPPIINTGNKGAAERQPGDWLCGKCNYHNWRRRKVCQTCYPYAEGNGDSISAAMQAERIALLTNVLSTQFDALDLKGHPPPSQSQPLPSSALPYPSRTFDGVPASAFNVNLGHGNGRNLERERERECDLSSSESPIYQTSGAAAGQHRPLPRTLLPPHASSPTTATYERSSHKLLPSFLQDLVYPPPSSHPHPCSHSHPHSYSYSQSQSHSQSQSQSQSPSPTASSTDLSYDGSSEDAHYVLSPTAISPHAIATTLGQGLGLGSPERRGSTSSFTSLTRSTSTSTSNSIWKLDGEESKSLTPSASASACTSPTTAYAQVQAQAQALPRSIAPGPCPAAATAISVPRMSMGLGGSTSTTSALAVDFDFQSGSTPKCTAGFWQARYS